ncbi:MAG: histidine phosphatase family protein [Stigonema ocellatum SAG 48.90 = DSM 106950]|nr:histidine phosphatase family protein [Stigonema ocellatum SAG 48.90 = DSM 106950]
MRYELPYSTVKILYLVRHCQSSGQQPDAPLTEEGQLQATLLSEFFSRVSVERIVSSPFLRAYQSITPVASKLGMTIELDDRLKERVLSTKMLPDWLEWLRQTFDDLDLCLVGGESSRAAMQRVVAVADEIFLHDAKVTLIATHGQLMTLLLKHFNENIGFNEWQSLTNPDIYKVVVGKGHVEVKRVWQEL